MTDSKKRYIFKNNLKNILNNMIPGDEFMPCFSHAVKIETIIKKYLKNKLLLNLKKKKIKIFKKKDIEIYQKLLGNDILDTYFTSNSVINSLNLRKKYYLKDIKKENVFKLLKKAKHKKQFFRE